MLAKRYACCTNPSGHYYWAHEINVRDRYDNDECLKNAQVINNNVTVMIITGPNLLAPLSAWGLVSIRDLSTFYPRFCG